MWGQETENFPSQVNLSTKKSDGPAPTKADLEIFDSIFRNIWALKWLNHNKTTCCTFTELYLKSLNRRGLELKGLGLQLVSNWYYTEIDTEHLAQMKDDVLVTCKTCKTCKSMRYPRPVLPPDGAQW